MKKQTKLDTSVSNKGISSEIFAVLSDNWQTNSLISAQLVFRPETLARYRKRFNHSGTRCEMARCVAQSIWTLCRSGFVEKRVNESTGKMEYKLSQKGVEEKQQQLKPR